MASIAAAPHAARHSTAYRRRKIGKEIAFWLLLSLFIIFAAFPVYWMVVTAFKQVNDLYNLNNNPFVFNLPPTLEQVQYLFEHTPYAKWLANTAEGGLLVLLITLVICLPAPSALARTNFPASGHLGL